MYNLTWFLKGSRKFLFSKKIIKDLVHPHMQPPAIKENFIAKLRYGVKGKRKKENMPGAGDSNGQNLLH